MTRLTYAQPRGAREIAITALITVITIPLMEVSCVVKSVYHGSSAAKAPTATKAVIPRDLISFIETPFFCSRVFKPSFNPFTCKRDLKKVRKL